MHLWDQDVSSRSMPGRWALAEKTERRKVLVRLVSVNTETDTRTVSLRPSAAEGSDSQSGRCPRGRPGSAVPRPRPLVDLPQDVNRAALACEQGRPFHGLSDQLTGLQGTRCEEAG